MGTTGASAGVTVISTGALQYKAESFVQDFFRELLASLVTEPFPECCYPDRLPYRIAKEPTPLMFFQEYRPELGPL